MSANRLRSYLILLIVAIIWGIASPVVKFTLHYFDWRIFVSYRFFLTAIIMLPMLIITQKNLQEILQKLSPSRWLQLLGLGLLGALGQIGFIFWGLKYTTSIDTSLILATSPIVVSLCGVLFLKEKVEQHELVGLILASFGSVLVILQPLFQSGSVFTGSFYGNFLVFCGVICWSIYIIMSKMQLKDNLPPLFITTISFTVSFVVITMISLAQIPAFTIIEQFVRAPWYAHLGVSYMAVFSGALAYTLYQFAQKFIETSEAEIFNYLPPLVAAPLGVLWLGEQLTPWYVISGVLIVMGVILSEYRFQQKKN